MNQRRRTGWLAAAAIATLAVAAGCSKTESESQAAEQKPAEPAADQKEKPAEPAAPTATADYIRVEAEHTDRKPTDPVVISFEKFRVTKAEFDPDDLEGGRAEIEIDMTSLASGIGKRDRHLAGEDFFHVSEFAKGTIVVDQVKKAGDRYSAVATVTIRGNEKSVPVSFAVVDRKGSAVVIEGEQAVTKADFGVGLAHEGSSPNVLVKVRLTLEPTA